MSSEFSTLYAKDDIRLKKALQEKVRQRIATMSFFEYFKYINRDKKKFKVGKHIKFICDKLDKVMEGEITRLAVYMPPQHGKSETITKAFPSYYLMKTMNPVIVLSYSDKLSARFGASNLGLVKEYGHLFGVKIDHRRSGKHLFGLEGSEESVVLSNSIRSDVTGFSAGLIIVDDPVKGPSDLSKVKRNEIYDLFDANVMSRESADCAIILVMTRWHKDDLAGRVVDEDWDVVSLPILAEENDVLGRQVGEALFPEIRKTTEWVLRKRSKTSPKRWSSLYMQKPSVEGGEVITYDDIMYFNEKMDIKEFGSVYMTWDPTLKGGPDSDYCVGQVWGVKDDKYYLIKQVRGQWDYKTTLKMYDKLVEEYRRYLTKVLIENKAAGVVLLTDRGHESFVVPVNPRGSKEERVDNASILFKDRSVYLPSFETFTDDLVLEAVGFGSEKYDDCIDACAQFLNYMRENRNKRKGYSKGGVAVSSGAGVRKDLSVRNSNNALKNVGSKKGVFARR